MTLVVGVLALQGGFVEHIALLEKAAAHLASAAFSFVQVRTAPELAACDALIIPGGESTTISLVASQSGLLEPLRDFVQVQQRPVWGTCAGLILLSDEANATKKGGQELIGGLAVRVHRNHFGRQIESFEAPLDLPFLSPAANKLHQPQAESNGTAAPPFPGVFIRAPVVEKILEPRAADGVHSRPPVQVLAKLPGRLDRMKEGMSQASTKDDSGDIVAVRQGNVLGTSFHPELTPDARIHVWWLQELLRSSSPPPP